MKQQKSNGRFKLFFHDKLCENELLLPITPPIGNAEDTDVELNDEQKKGNGSGFCRT